MATDARAAAAEEAIGLTNERHLDEEMGLADRRRALRLSQEEVANTLQIGQGSVAKLERRADMYVGTMRRFIEAMGGELEIVARFPDRSVRIKTFHDPASHG